MPRILLVEDDEMNLEMLTKRLSKRGFDVIQADNGQMAIDQAVKELPDLILMDVGLPLVDGYEATRRLKADPPHAMPSDHKKSLEAGGDDYDTKPIDLPRLMTKMQGLLNRSERVRVGKNQNDRRRVDDRIRRAAARREPGFEFPRRRIGHARSRQTSASQLGSPRGHSCGTRRGRHCGQATLYL